MLASLLPAALGRALLPLGLLSVLGLAACLDRPLGVTRPRTTNIFVDVISQESIERIDLLFMIDNSSSTGPSNRGCAPVGVDYAHRFVLESPRAETRRELGGKRALVRARSGQVTEQRTAESAVGARSEAARPNAVDLCFQAAYRVAYKLMRAYWGVRRPSTHGALVSLWNQGELLLVQNSYVPYRSLPGGYVARSETSREAAVRELREEIGIFAQTEQLEKVFDEVKEWEGKKDHVEIFALELERRPEIRIDHREVVAAGWFSPEQALTLNLFPPIRKIIEARQRAAVRGPGA